MSAALVPVIVSLPARPRTAVTPENTTVVLALSKGSTHVRTHVDVDTEIGLSGIEGILETRERFRVTNVVISHDMASTFRIAHRAYLLAVIIGMTPLFAFITFSHDVLYPTYEFAPRLYPELDAAADQLLAGTMMKIVGLMVAVAALAFFTLKEPVIEDDYS